MFNNSVMRHIIALVGAFNQEKALIGAFSMIVKFQTSRRFVSSSNNMCCLSALYIEWLKMFRRLTVSSKGNLKKISDEAGLGNIKLGQQLSPDKVFMFVTLPDKVFILIISRIASIQLPLLSRPARRLDGYNHRCGIQILLVKYGSHLKCRKV